MSCSRDTGGLPEDLTYHGPCFVRAFPPLRRAGPCAWLRPWESVAPQASLPSPLARPRLVAPKRACCPPYEGNPGLTPGFPSLWPTGADR